ncbi:MAG: pyrroline-5-carboxylate reductase [Kiritimatiellia bacterium]
MKIGFIGCGKMAEAMISSLIGSRAVVPHELFASDIRAERRAAVKKQYGVNAYSKNTVVPGNAETVFLAVKPQNLDEVLREIAGGVTDEHLIVSIVAGKKIAHIESILTEARVIRVMPNLGCLSREAMSVFCAGKRTTENDRRTAEKLLSAFGRVMELPETKFDVVTALSGSGPAFFTYLMKLFVDVAVDHGIGRKHASKLAIQTMLGTSRLLAEGKMQVDELLSAVTSSKGTTAAGMEVLENSDIRGILRDTIKAAAERSRELSG